MFFPHLVAGPIVRYRDVVDDFRDPKISADNFARGVTRFAHGLAKKIIIADAIAPIVDAVFDLPPGEANLVTAWFGAAAYGLQIYFDFSGYSDMAIGLALMLGIRFRENFERPYVSCSITEFWRRWHISLSSWFRDYDRRSDCERRARFLKDCRHDTTPSTNMSPSSSKTPSPTLSI